MKVYNKKGFVAGIFWIILAVWSVFLDFNSPDPNGLVRVRDTILSVFLLLLGITSFVRAFSKRATKEDIINKQDERNILIRYKSKSRMLDIAYGFLFVFMICGLIGYKLTANIAWGMIFLIPGFLLGLFLIIEIVVNIYYEKHV